MSFAERLEGGGGYYPGSHDTRAICAFDADGRLVARIQCEFSHATKREQIAAYDGFEDELVDLLPRVDGIPSTAFVEAQRAQRNLDYYLALVGSVPDCDVRQYTPHSGIARRVIRARRGDITAPVITRIEWIAAGSGYPWGPECVSA